MNFERKFRFMVVRNCFFFVEIMTSNSTQIYGSLQTIIHELKSLGTRISAIESQMTGFEVKMTTIESKISDTDSMQAKIAALEPLQSKITGLEELQAKVTTLENKTEFTTLTVNGDLTADNIIAKKDFTVADKKLEQLAAE